MTLENEIKILEKMTYHGGNIERSVSIGLSLLNIDNYGDGIKIIEDFLHDCKPNCRAISENNNIIVLVAYQYKGDTKVDYTIIEE